MHEDELVRVNYESQVRGVLLRAREAQANAYKRLVGELMKLPGTETYKEQAAFLEEMENDINEYKKQAYD